MWHVHVPHQTGIDLPSARLTCVTGHPLIRKFRFACRKAIRLGKFLSNYSAVLRLHRKPANILPIIAGTGEGVYFFLDQFVWYYIVPSL